MPLASPLEIVPLEGPIGASVRGLDLEADWKSAKVDGKAFPTVTVPQP